jgi:hypothetical protein
MSENLSAHRDTFNLLCDDRIGHGMSRQVYRSKILPHAVIKVEEVAQSFQNIMEWETWQMVKGTPAEKWFAPCEYISPQGIVLIMAKTTEPAADQYPEQMPVFLSDFKRANYGIYEGRLVCHDYGTNLSMHHGLFTKKMRKVEWWNL